MAFPESISDRVESREKYALENQPKNSFSIGRFLDSNVKFPGDSRTVDSQFHHVFQEASSYNNVQWNQDISVEMSTLELFYQIVYI